MSSLSEIDITPTSNCIVLYFNSSSQEFDTLGMNIAFGFPATKCQTSLSVWGYCNVLNSHLSYDCLNKYNYSHISTTRIVDLKSIHQ